jgi:hypothetical protein
MENRALQVLIALACVLALVGCPDETPVALDQTPESPAPPPPPPPPPLPDPIISGVNPSPVEPGQTVTISGAHFGINRFVVTVSFAGSRALVRSFSDTLITAEVPILVVPGAVEVKVAVIGAHNVATSTLDVQLGIPVISFLNSSSLDPGEVMEVNGRNFGSDTSQARVTFDSLPGTITILSNSHIAVVVPEAAERGPAAVRVKVGERTSAPVSVTIRPPSPVISAVGPSLARPGSDIVVLGSHFGSEASRLSVQFCRLVPDSYYYYYYGGVQECVTASFMNLRDNSVTVHVPRSLERDNWDLILTVMDARLQATAHVDIL